jgi:hypothetical protein
MLLAEKPLYTDLQSAPVGHLGNLPFWPECNVLRLASKVKNRQGRGHSRLDQIELPSKTDAN